MALPVSEVTSSTPPSMLVLYNRNLTLMYKNMTCSLQRPLNVVISQRYIPSPSVHRMFPLSNTYFSPLCPHYSTSSIVLIYKLLLNYIFNKKSHLIVLLCRCLDNSHIFLWKAAYLFDKGVKICVLRQVLWGSHSPHARFSERYLSETDVTSAGWQQWHLSWLFYVFLG